MKSRKSSLLNLHNIADALNESPDCLKQCVENGDYPRPTLTPRGTLCWRESDLPAWSLILRGVKNV
jgi:hypothetical protein